MERKKSTPRKEKIFLTEERLEEIWKIACEEEQQKLREGEKNQDKLWEKACEEERNFEKACWMAEGFLPIKSEADYEFMKKWIFLSLP